MIYISAYFLIYITFNRTFDAENNGVNIESKCIVLVIWKSNFLIVKKYWKTGRIMLIPSSRTKAYFRKKITKQVSCTKKLEKLKLGQINDLQKLFLIIKKCTF